MHDAATQPQFADLPPPLRAAIFVAACEQGPDPAITIRAVRLVCREARTVVDGRGVTALRLKGVTLLTATFRDIAAKFPSLRVLGMSGTYDVWEPKLGDFKLAELADVLWPRLQELDLSRSGLGAAAAATLAAATAHFPALRKLDLSGNTIGNCTALMRSAWPVLEELMMNDCWTDHDATLPVAALATAQPRNFPVLRCLQLEYNELHDDAVIALAAVTWPCLTSLNLASNEISTAAASALLAAGPARFPVLRRVDVSDNAFDLPAWMPAQPTQWPGLQEAPIAGVSGSGAAALLTMATPWPALEEVSCACVPGDAAVTLIAVAARYVPALRSLDVSRHYRPSLVLAVARQTWPCLEVLKASRTRMDASAATALAAAATAGRLPKLRVLELDRAEMEFAAVAALANGAWTSLHELSLAGNVVPPKGAAALAREAGRCLSNLRKLVLTQTKLGAAGVKALMQAKWPQLEVLELAGNEMHLSGGTALAAAVAAGRLPALRRLNLAENSLGQAGVAALARAWVPMLEQAGVAHNTNVLSTGARAAGQLPALRHLDLDRNNMERFGLEALLAASWSSLAELALAHNNLTADAGAVLASAQRNGRLPVLQMLVLHGNDFGNAGTAALLRTTWPKLRELMLDSAGLGGAFLLAAKGPKQLPALTALDLGTGAVGVEGSHALRTLWPNVRVRF